MKNTGYHTNGSQLKFTGVEKMKIYQIIGWHNSCGEWYDVPTEIFFEDRSEAEEYAKNRSLGSYSRYKVSEVEVN